MHVPFFSQRSRGILTILIAVLVTGCGVSDPKSPRFIVAKGKGVKITRAKLDETESQFLAQRGVQVHQIPETQRAVLDQQLSHQLVIQALLLQEAANLKLLNLDVNVDTEVKKIQAQVGGEEALKDRLQKMGMTLPKLKENILQQLRVQEVLRIRVPIPTDPSSETIEKFYTKNKNEFSHPTMVKVRHVLVQVPRDATPDLKSQKKKVINAARARVTKGEDFAKVAKEVSEDPGSASQGGDLGFFKQGQMVPQFEKVAFGTKVGTVSPVFETPYGYHFLLVTGFKPAGVLSLEEARPQIVSYFKNQQRAENLKNYLSKLETDAKVVYDLATPKEPDSKANSSKLPKN